MSEQQKITFSRSEKEEADRIRARTISLAEGLSCTLDSTKEHPVRYITLLNGEQSLSLDKVQALALFRLMLSHLGQIAGPELHKEGLLEQIGLVQAFHNSIAWLANWEQDELEEPELLTEAHEQYQHTYALQEEMLDVVNGWQITLERTYGKLEDAAETLGVALEDLGEVEEGDEEEGDEEDEN